MVDLTVTPASVVAGTNTQQQHGLAGATITAGQLVVLDPVTKKYLLADANHATVALREPTGVALNGAALNQPVSVLTAGDITIGATIVAGGDYWASQTAGAICDRAGVIAGSKVVQVGVAKSTTVLAVDFQKPGVQL